MFLELEFITNEKIKFTIVTLLLLSISIILNSYAFIIITLPLWICLLSFFLYGKIEYVPSQQKMKDKWGYLLISNSTVFNKNTNLTLQQFQNLYIDSYQQDQQLRKIEYQYYQQNSKIFAIQINNKEMEYFPNEHFQLSNGQLVSVQKYDWIVTDKPLGDIYLIQDKTLQNTYQ